MKILIIHTNAGAGHRRAAEAVYEAVLQDFHEIEVKIVDTLEYTTPLLKKVYPATYVILVRYFSWLWKFFYYYCNFKFMEKFNHWLRHQLMLTQKGNFMELIQSEAPDLIFTTHYLPNDYLSIMKAKGQFEGFVATCLTDYEPHLMWKDSGIDRYFVANEAMLTEMKRLDFPLEKVKISGIPVHKEFTIAEDKIKLREKLGLKPDQFTILLASGGFGLGPVKALAREITKIQQPVQVLVVCGHNVELKKQVEQEIKGSIHSFRLFEFVKNIHELMSASELLISKPGGLTTTEAMAKGLPMLIYQPIPGQETANCKMLLQHQAALELKEIADLPQIVMKLLDHPEKLQTLQENMKALGRPQAALEIVAEMKKIMEMR